MAGLVEDDAAGFVPGTDEAAADAASPVDEAGVAGVLGNGNSPQSTD